MSPRFSAVPEVPNMLSAAPFAVPEPWLAPGVPDSFPAPSSFPGTFPNSSARSRRSLVVLGPWLVPDVPSTFPGVPFVLVTFPAPGCYVAASGANPRYLGRLLVTSWMSSLPTPCLGAGPSLLLLLLLSLGLLSSCSCSSSPWLQYFEGGHYTSQDEKFN